MAGARDTTMAPWGSGSPARLSSPRGRAAATGAEAGEEAAWGHHVPASVFCPPDSGLGGNTELVGCWDAVVKA